MQLENARAWITGASSGIGEALAGALARAGARVALTARRQDRLDDLARSWREAGHDVMVCPADVSNREAVICAARAVEAAWGGIDLAVFNAGFSQRIRWSEFDARDFKAIFEVNLFGVMYGVEAVLPGMLQRGSGRIAAVGSLAGYRGAPTLAGYGSSKAALIHAMDSLRFDLAPLGVGVTLINPGYVRTPLTASHTYWMPALMDAEPAAAIILRGLQRDRKEIHFPARFSWALKVLRVLPFPIYERIVSAAVSRGAR
jgi:short-subunit dehydrogenase